MLKKKSLHRLVVEIEGIRIENRVKNREVWERDRGIIIFIALIFCLSVQ